MQPRCTNGSFSLKLESGRVAICVFPSPLRGPNGTTHCDVSHHAHQRVPASLASSSDRGRNELHVREREKKSRTCVGWTGTGMEGDRPGSAIGPTRQAPVPPPPSKAHPFSRGSNSSHPPGCPDQHLDLLPMQQKQQASRSCFRQGTSAVGRGKKPRAIRQRQKSSKSQPTCVPPLADVPPR